MVGVRFSPYELPSRYRKERKPIIEKLRRERMNTSISQLKDLISETIQRNAAPISRVDKADILEYAVLHLQELRQRLHTTSGSLREADTQSYDMGFKDCAREAVTFLNIHRLADNTVTNVSNHLHTVYMARRPATGSRSSGTSGPSLSTPVRRHNIVDESRLPKQPVPECSPIQRYHKASSPHVMTPFRIPEIDTSLGDLSFNTVMGVFNSTESSNSDVSMRSKGSSLTDSDSFCSNKFSKMMRFPTGTLSHDLSIGTVESVTDEMSTSEDSEDNHDDVYVDVIPDVETGVPIDSVSHVPKPEVVSACVWRPW